MLAFSAFAAETTIGTSTLNIIANVKSITPTYSLRAISQTTYDEKNDPFLLNKKDSSTSAGVENITTDVDTTKGTRFTNNTNTTKDDKTLTVYISLIQSEARYGTDVNVKFEFTALSYSGETTQGGETLTGKFATNLPTVTMAHKRAETIACQVEDTNVAAGTTNGVYSFKLNYSIFGYFMKENTGLVTLKAVYEIPAYATSGEEYYMPFGAYTGTVKVTYTTGA